MTALAALYGAAKRLGLDDDTRRDVYERVTGKRSAREMTPAEVRRVLDELNRLAGTKPSSKPVRSPTARLAQALWKDLWNLGVIARRSDDALEAFIRRQCRVDSVHWLRDPKDGDRVIRALTAWAARPIEDGGGGVDWRFAARPARSSIDASTGDARWAVVDAQWRRIASLDPINTGGDGLPLRAFAITGKDASAVYAAEDWHAVMDALGIHLRALLGRRAGH